MTFFSKNITNTHKIAGAAIFVVLHVILGYFSIKLAPTMVLGFAFLPFAWAGYLFGPIIGMQVGFVADILAYIMHPHGPFYFGFTINSILVCFIYGYFLFNKEITFKRVFFAVLLTNILISFVLNPIWLYHLYGTNVFAIKRALVTLFKFPINVLLAYYSLLILRKLVYKIK